MNAIAFQLTAAMIAWPLYAQQSTCRNDEEARRHEASIQQLFLAVENSQFDRIAGLLEDPKEAPGVVIDPLRYAEAFGKRDVKLIHHFSPTKVCTYGGTGGGGHNDEIMTDAEYIDTVEVLERDGDKGYVFRGEWVRFYVFYHPHYDANGKLRTAPPFIKRY